MLFMVFFNFRQSRLFLFKMLFFRVVVFLFIELIFIIDKEESCVIWEILLMDDLFLIVFVIFLEDIKIGDGIKYSFVLKIEDILFGR